MKRFWNSVLPMVIMFLFVIAVISGCGGGGAGGGGGTSPSPTPTTGDVEGIVSDLNGNPLAGAQVTVGATTDTTDNEGNYSLQNLDAGTRTITATLSGYADVSETVVITAGQTAAKNITMSPIALEGFAGVMKVTSFDASQLDPVKVTQCILINDTRTIPAGTHEVTIPTGQTYKIEDSTNPEGSVSNYYYGNPATHVGNTVLKFTVTPPPSVVPYEAVIPVASGSEGGDYLFGINDYGMTVTSNALYPPMLNVTSPTQAEVIDRTNPLTVTWDSMGADYVYLVTASNIGAEPAPTWSSIDIRDYSWGDPESIQVFLNNCTGSTSLTIPGNIFDSGGVAVLVLGFDKNSLAYTTEGPYGQLKLTYSFTLVTVAAP